MQVPDQALAVVSLDFIGGLPASNKFDVIMVVIDRFTKYAHFVPLSHPFTALQVAQLYVNHIYKLHGLPKISFQIGTGSLQARFGSSCSSCLALSYA